MSAILTIEGPAGFGFDPELLESLFLAGFRISTLGWNEQNPLIGSHLTGGGLTDLGKAYVQNAQALGMLVDVSHCSDEGFWDIVKITGAPIIASHSNSRAVWNHSRNVTDDMFRAIRETGGVPPFWEKMRRWIQSVTTFSTLWSWIRRGSTSPLEGTWTVAASCLRALPG